MKVKKLDLFVRRAKAGRIVSLTGFRRKLHVGFCLIELTSIDDINFTDLNKHVLFYVGIDMSIFIYVAVRRYQENTIWK